MALRLQERTTIPTRLTVGLPVIAVLATLVITSVAVLLTDATPLSYYAVPLAAVVTLRHPRGPRQRDPAAVHGAGRGDRLPGRLLEHRG